MPNESWVHIVHGEQSFKRRFLDSEMYHRLLNNNKPVCFFLLNYHYNNQWTVTANEPEAVLGYGTK